VLQLCDLYENDSIFDKFECCLSGDGQRVATGSYRCVSSSGIPHITVLKRIQSLHFHLQGVMLYCCEVFLVRKFDDCGSVQTCMCSKKVLDSGCSHVHMDKYLVHSVANRISA